MTIRGWTIEPGTQDEFLIDFTEVTRTFTGPTSLLEPILMGEKSSQLNIRITADGDPIVFMENLTLSIQRVPEPTAALIWLSAVAIIAVRPVRVQHRARACPERHVFALMAGAIAFVLITETIKAAEFVIADSEADHSTLVPPHQDTSGLGVWRYFTALSPAATGPSFLAELTDCSTGLCGNRIGDTTQFPGASSGSVRPYSFRQWQNQSGGALADVRVVGEAFLSPTTGEEHLTNGIDFTITGGGGALQTFFPTTQITAVGVGGAVDFDFVIPSLNPSDVIRFVVAPSMNRPLSSPVYGLLRSVDHDTSP